MAYAPWADPAVYRVARQWVEECLGRDGSLFTPGQQIWTEQNAVAGGQRWGASAGALIDQHLMCQQQGLGGHRADSTGPQECGTGREQGDDEEKCVPHALNGTTRVVMHKTVLATSFSNSPLTRYIQPTRQDLVKVRGKNSVYHYNAIQSRRVEPDGRVRNIYA